MTSTMTPTFTLPVTTAIRPAEVADCPQITDLWNHYIRTTTITFNSIEKTLPEVEGVLAEKAAAGQPFLVALDGDGRVSGFATYGSFRGGIGYQFTAEHSILLDPDAVGKGQGRALIEALCTHGKAAGLHSLWAGVSGENDAGVAFHARVGFQTVARLSQVGFKFGRWLDLTLMQRML